jgi:WD40 repeat protein
VQVWEATTGRRAQNYRGHSDIIAAAVWSPDGQYIASASADKTVQIWEATTGKQLLSYHKHTERVTAVTWSPDGKYIASGSADKTVQVWEAMTGKLLYAYNGYNVAEARQNPTKGVPPDVIYAVAWSHNGKWIAAVTQIYCGDDCGEVLIWDALTQEHFKFYPTQPMYTLAISPNDKYLASSTGISQVQVALAP